MFLGTLYFDILHFVSLGRSIMLLKMLVSDFIIRLQYCYEYVILQYCGIMPVHFTWLCCYDISLLHCHIIFLQHYNHVVLFASTGGRAGRKLLVVGSEHVAHVTCCSPNRNLLAHFALHRLKGVC